MPEGEEKWAKLYELDPALRSEFTSKAAYVAFMDWEQKLAAR
jgi:hypothetical protein